MRKINILLTILGVLVLAFFTTLTINCDYNAFVGVGEEVDSQDPNIRIVIPASGSYVKEEFTLAGTASDNDKVKSIVVYLDNPAMSWSLGGGKSWSKTFTAADGLGPGEKQFTVYAYDKSKNSAYTTTFLIIDNDLPTVNILSPDLKGDDLSFDGLSTNNYTDLEHFTNGSFEIKGEITDSGPIELTTLRLLDDNTLDTYYEGSISRAGDLSGDVTGNTKNWTFTIDSSADLPDDRKYLVQVIVQEIAGDTISSNDMGYIYVLQSSDIPQVNITSPLNASTIYPDSIASGTSFDDDGLDKIYWYVGTTDPTDDYNQWVAGTSNNHGCGLIDLSDDNPPGITSWNFDTPSGTGAFKIYIWPVDINGLAPASLTDLSSVSFTQVSAASPLATIDGPNPAVTQIGDVTVDITANGAGANVTEIWYDVSSDLTSDSWVQKVSPGDFTAATVVNYSFVFDSTRFVNETVHDIRVRVYCVNDNPDTSPTITTYLRADNTDPTISITSPGALGVINGTTEIKGTASDWSTVKALYMGYFTNMTDSIMDNTYDTEAKLENDTQGAETINQWHKVLSPSTSWSYDLETLVISAGTINPYYFYVAAVDTIGNVSYASQQYTLNQDLDKPTVNITQPSYSGSTTQPWTTVDVMDKFGSNFLITGVANDDDGVNRVRVDVHLMTYTGSDHTIDSTSEASTDVVGTDNWSFTLEDLTVCAADQYYMIVPYVRDIYSREESGTPSYFRVSNETPEIFILWPSTVDPDRDQRQYVEEAPPYHDTVNDVFGTVVSNVKDDIYWDNNVNNNHLYLADSTKFFFGWENDVTNDDLDNNGFPDANNDGTSDNWAAYCTDFNEDTLNIFDQDTTDDQERLDYFRMIFKAKDNGNITKVELSENGGSTWETAFEDGNSDGDLYDGGENKDTSKFAILDATDDLGYFWFYVNLDIGDGDLQGSQIVKIKVTDDNMGTPYFSIATVQLTCDDTNPTGSFESWGAPGQQISISSSAPYFAGTAVDNDTGIKYAKLYIWDNEGTVETPNYGVGVSGSLTANIDVRTFTVNIPDLTDIDTGASDPDADYMVDTTMDTTVTWKVEDIYHDINPVDGYKLVCLQVMDNAGNLNHYFVELTFSEYPPTIDDVNMWWATMSAAQKIDASGDELTDRMWISGDLSMDGDMGDAKAGDPDPGIRRVRVLIYDDASTDLSGTPHATWSTEEDGDREITDGTGDGVGPFTWTLTGQDTSADVTGLDGDYLMVIEVQDKVGVVVTQFQHVYIDNTAPALVVDDPIQLTKVTGDFNINGTASDAGGFNTDCINIQIWDSGAPTDTSWDVTPSGGGNWSQWWDTTSPADFDQVKVAFTDKALNVQTITRDVSEDASPPNYTEEIIITDTDGAATLLNFTTFSNLYTETANKPVFIVRGNISVDNTIDDDEAITDSGVYVSGMLQANDNTTDRPYQSFDPSTDAGAPYEVGYTGSYAYNGLANGEYTYRAWIEQQAGAIEVNLKKYFIEDSQKPHIWIEEMLATDTTADSGHIEKNSTYDGTDDDVSGNIFIDFKVFDNYLIDYIQVRCTDYDFGNGDGNWVTIIDRDNGTGALSPVDRGAIGDLDYFDCYIDSETLQENENSMSLTLELNTANLTGIVGFDKNLEFRVFDMAGNESDEAGQSEEQSSDPVISHGSPDTDFQRIARKPIDIVPYITSVVRLVPDLNTNRSKYGKYPVREQETGITINGYNIERIDVGDYVGVFNTAGDESDDVTVTASGTPFTSMTVSMTNVTHSGWLNILLNGVLSINNINDNSADTNQEDDPYVEGSDLWNDDRYLSIWETGDSFNQSASAKHPSMSINSSGVLYGAWSNYSDSDIYYATTAGASRVSIFGCYDPAEHTDIYLDGDEITILFNGNYYQNAGWADNHVMAGGVQLYEDTPPATGYPSNVHRLELLYHDQMLMQFINQRVVREGDDIHSVWYDTETSSLKYTYVDQTWTTTTERSWINIDGGSDPDDVGTGDGNGVGLVRDGTVSRSTSAGQYSAIDVDEADRPVIMYYDINSQTLRLARSTQAVADASDDWSLQTVFQASDANKNFTGKYVTMRIDASGDIHAACVKTSTGELLYLHADNVDGDTDYVFDKSVVVDTIGSVGPWADISLDGSTSYISYLNMTMSGTFDGVKMAYWDPNLDATGDWEYIVAPAETAVENVRTSVEYKKGAVTWRAAIGYGSDSFDVVYLKPEE